MARTMGPTAVEALPRSMALVRATRGAPWL